MKDSTKRPEHLRLISLNGEIVGKAPSIPTVDVYPAPYLATSNGVRVDKKAELMALVPPPAQEMFTDKEVEKHGGETDEKFEGIVQTKLGDAAARGAKIIAGRPYVASEQLGDD